MNKQSMALVALVAATVVVLGDCKKDDAATQPPPAGPQLTLSQAAVSVRAGDSTSVTVSGGQPSYVIAANPDARARARFLNPDSAAATLRITGVSTASGSTAVVVRDNSTPTQKSATVQITVLP